MKLGNVQQGFVDAVARNGGFATMTQLESTVTKSYWRKDFRGVTGVLGTLVRKGILCRVSVTESGDNLSEVERERFMRGKAEHPKAQSIVILVGA